MREREKSDWDSRRRRRLAAVGGLIVALAAIVLVVGGRLGPRDRTWQRIQEEGIIRVGLEASFPPFEMLDPATGMPVGYDIDLAVALGRELGDIRPEFVNVGFDSLYDQLLAGRFDAIISALPVDRVWTEDVRYSQPYFQAGLVIVTRADLEMEIKRPEDMVGRRIAIEWGSEGDAYGRQLSRRAGDLHLLSHETPHDALEAVRAGDADASLVDAVSAYQFIGENEDLVIVGAPLTEVSYAIAVRHTSPLLGKAVDEALTTLRVAGVLDELLRKWL